MSKEKNNNQSPRPHSSPRQQKLIKSALQYEIQNMLTNKYGRSCTKSLIHMVNIKPLLLFKYLRGDISLFLCISSDFKIPPLFSKASWFDQTLICTTYAQKIFLYIFLRMNLTSSNVAHPTSGIDLNKLESTPLYKDSSTQVFPKRFSGQLVYEKF